jgi:hypothetical protein
MVEESTNNPAPPPAPESKPESDPSCTRCVVLIGPDGTAPADLLGGLSRRGVSSRVVAGPADVMVELARQRTGVLVVVEPGRQPGLADLIEAVKTYHPRTVRWGYRSSHPSGKAQLQPLNGQQLGDATALNEPPKPLDAAPPRATDDITRSPLGRIQGQVPSDRVRSLIVKVQGPAEVGEPLISEEELAMLLGPLPEEPGGET